MKIGLREAAEVLGVASIVGSLIFVGLEMNQTQQIALNESGYYIVESGFAQRTAINEHPDIWAKGNAGKELNTAEVVIYENQLEGAWAVAYWTSQTFRRFGYDQDVSLNDFAAFLHRNPGARKTWQEFSNHEQMYRELLLDTPAGRAEAEAVFLDLEYLDGLKIE